MLALLYELKVKDNLTVKPSQNPEKILARARGFVKLEEEDVHHQGNVLSGRTTRREDARRLDRDQTDNQKPRVAFLMFKVTEWRDNPRMVKLLRNFGQIEKMC